MKFILGVLGGLLVFPFLCDLVRLADTKLDTKLTHALTMKTYVVGYGSTKALEGNCTKDAATNGHGWTFITREYYGCNKLSILISDLVYGEYRYERDPELEKKACKGCSL